MGAMLAYESQGEVIGRAILGIQGKYCLLSPCLPTSSNQEMEHKWGWSPVNTGGWKQDLLTPTKRTVSGLEKKRMEDKAIK